MGCKPDIALVRETFKVGCPDADDFGEVDLRVAEIHSPCLYPSDVQQVRDMPLKKPRIAFD